MNHMLEIARSEGHRPRMPRASAGMLKPICAKEQRVIDYVREHPQSSVRQIREALGMASADVKSCVNKSRIRGILTMTKQHGHGGEWKRYKMKEATE